MTVRIARNGLHTEFSQSVKTSDIRDEFGRLKIMRVFHPVEGEQVRLEMYVGRTLAVKHMGRDTHRTDGKEHVLTLTPEQADQLVAAIQGIKRK